MATNPTKPTQPTPPGLNFTRYPQTPPQPRTKPMEVLCLGLSRTGTMSLHVALDTLSLKSYHAMEMGLDNANGSIARWKKGIEAKYFGRKEGKLESEVEFEKLLWRYQTVTDIPCALFADELLRAYPGAKVVLTTRDEEGWIRSVRNSFHAILSWRVWTLLQLIDWEHSRVYIPLLHYCLQIWTDGDENNTQALREGYRRHNAHKRSIVPKERLLEYHVSQGWDPLCKFLNRPVPEMEMPRVNEGSWVVELHRRVVRMRFEVVARKALRWWVGPVIVAGMAWGAWRWWCW